MTPHLIWKNHVLPKRLVWCLFRLLLLEVTSQSGTPSYSQLLFSYSAFEQLMAAEGVVLLIPYYMQVHTVVLL